MTANVNVTKLLFKRGNTVQNANYTGINGEITVDTQAKTLRIHDGVTAGGNVITAGGVVGSYSNTNAAAYIPTDPTITSLQSNAATQAVAINTVNANIGAFQTYANITLSTVANAASQETQINLINANVTAANAIISNLQSNAGAQATSINSINANLGSFQTYANATFGTSNYGNTNVAAYLGAFDGNILPSANVTYSLGSETRQWKDLWVSNNTIYIGNTPIRVDGTTLLINGAPVSGGTYSNTNVAAYLLGNITTGNIKSGNLAATGNIVTNVRHWDSAGANLYVWFNAASTPELVTLGNFGNIAGWTVSVSDGNSATVTATNPAGYFSISTDVGLTGSGNLTFTSPGYQGETPAPMTISSGSNTWTFGTDGNLTLPGGGAIDGSDYDVDITAGNDGVGTFGHISFTANGPNGLNSFTYNSLGEITVVTAGANDGLIKWVGNSSGDGNGYTTMVMVPDTTREGTDQYIIIDPTGGEPGHIHIRAGGTQDSSAADLYLGGELTAVRVSDTSGIVTVRTTNIGDPNITMDWAFQPDGNLYFPGIGNNRIGESEPGLVVTSDNSVVLQSNNGGVSNEWTFGTDGNLTVPGNINYANGVSILSGIGGAVNGNIVVGDSQIQFVANSSGDGYGLSTIRLVPYTPGYDSAIIIIDPTYPNHIHMRAGFEQDNAAANLFLGGEASHFNVEEGANPNVSIRSNYYTWTFATDGNLTIPGNIITTGNSTTIGTANASVVLNNNLQSASLTVQKHYQEFYSNGDYNTSGDGADMFFANVGGQGQLNIQIISNQGVYLRGLLNRIYTRFTDGDASFYYNYSNVRFVVNPSVEAIQGNLVSITRDAVDPEEFTITLDQLPVPDPFTVSNIDIIYDFVNTIGMDAYENAWGIGLDDQNLVFRTGRDITLSATDDIEITSGSSLQLRLHKRDDQSPDSGVQIFTVDEGTEKPWTFSFGGDLFFPSAGAEFKIGTIDNNLRINTETNLRIYTDSLGVGHMFEFQNNGNLTIPGNINYANGVSILSGLGGGGVTSNILVDTSAIQFVASSSGDGNGYSTIRIIPDTNLEGTDQYLIIDPTVINHIHIRAGGTQDNSSADLFLGGENSHVLITAGSNPPVYIRANTASWMFGVDSSLSMPTGGNLYFDSSATSVIDGMTSIRFADTTTQTTAWTGTVNFGNTIAIGYNTGTVSQGGGAVAVGSTAGNVSQGVGAVAVGEAAGTSSQGTEGIAIGKTAGEQSQGAYSIAIGSAAAYYQQRTGAIAIGTSAGALQQGNHAIAIGTGAGSALQGNNSIILNATGSALEQTTANTFTVKPIRNASGSNVLYYDSTTGEITYDTAGAGSYGNTEVAAYLPTYTGNVGAARVQVTNAVDFMYGGFPYMGWQLSGSDTLKLRTNIASGDYTNDAVIVDRQSLAVNVVATLSAGNIITTSGVFWSNGTAYSTGSGTYGNTEVAAYLPTYTGNIGAGNVNVASTVYAANIVTSGTSGNISGVNVISANTFVFAANGVNILSAAGGGTYGNTEVAAYLLTWPNIDSNILDATSANITTLRAANFNSANAVISGGYISALTNASITTATITTLNSTGGNVTTLRVNNFGTANAVITGGYINSLANLSATTAVFTNFSTGNAVINGGYISSLTNASITTSVVTNFSTANAVITGGYASGLANVTATGNVTAGNLIGYGSNTNIVAGAYTSTFDNVGNVILPNAYVSGNTTVMGIAPGYAPNRPAFRVYGSGVNTTQTTGNVNLRNEVLTVDYNQGNYYNNTTGVFTAPVAGLYNTTLVARVANNNGLNQVAVLRNGNNIGANVVCFWETDTNAGVATHFGTSGTILLNAGEFLSANILAGNISFDGNDSWTVTYLG